MPKNKEQIISIVNQALGEASLLFMSQECKGTEIVMPTEDLKRIGEKLANDILEQ